MNTDVEDLLREGMERFTADLRAPAGLTHRAARRRRPRLALRLAATAATALTAGAVALAAAGVPGLRHHGVDTTAYVVQRVSSALSAAGPGQIAQMTVTTTRGAPVPGGTTATTTAEEWSYGGQWRSVTNSPSGHPVYDEGFSASSGYTLVNYQKRTWTRLPGTSPALPWLGPLPGLGLPVAQGFGAHGCQPVIAAVPLLFRPGLPGIGFSASSLPAASALRNAISCGTLEVAGRQRVDGIEAIKLTSRPDSPISETIWVTPSTYLPVRVVTRSAFGQPVLQQTADISWLPPTAQNLAELTVPVPAGYRQVLLAQAATPILKQIPGGLTAPCPASAGPACNGPGQRFGLRPEPPWPFPA